MPPGRGKATYGSSREGGHDQLTRLHSTRPSFLTRRQADIVHPSDEHQIEKGSLAIILRRRTPARPSRSCICYYLYPSLVSRWQIVYTRAECAGNLGASLLQAARRGKSQTQDRPLPTSRSHLLANIVLARGPKLRMTLSARTSSTSDTVGPGF